MNNNGLTTSQINNYLKGYSHYAGCFSKDQIPNIRPYQWAVVNMQSSNEGDKKGTHWVCVYVDNLSIIYLDSFGIVPPLEIIDLAKDKKIYYNEKQLQDEDSSCCGYFCVACILSNTENTLLDFKRFLNNFDTNTKRNDLILKMLLFKLLHKPSGIKL
jgi:hypothetical protein